MKRIIYETTGRAQEFAELACNIFSGCEHGCIYCYAPQITRKTRHTFTKPQARISPNDIFDTAKKRRDTGDVRRVLLSFTCDPYTPIEQGTLLTRKCILALHEAGLNVIILTKGGCRSMRDFDLLTDKDAYATTLTLTNESDSLLWEPNAAPPNERIEALKAAHDKGIETWASFEPVIYPSQTYELFQMTKTFTGHYKIGTMNYHPQGQAVNWHKFGWQMKGLMDNCQAKYYFKKDLLKEMGVPFNQFKQTWICH